MTKLQREFEALMPEPAGYSPFPGEFYPSEQVDAAVKDDPFVTRLYTADQVREAMKAVAERCAVIADEKAERVNSKWIAHDIAAAIRAQAGGDQT